MSTPRYKSFSEFWPFYVAEHSKPATRVLHLIGTTAGISLLVYLIATGRGWLFFLGFVPGYGFAWLAHFLVEKNKPATFKLSLIHISEPTRLLSISYAVFCLKKK